MPSFPDPKLPLRTTSPIFGGPIHAAVGNRQQRPDHCPNMRGGCLAPLPRRMKCHGEPQCASPRESILAASVSGKGQSQDRRNCFAAWGSRAKLEWPLHNGIRKPMTGQSDAIGSEFPEQYWKHVYQPRYNGCVTAAVPSMPSSSSLPLAGHIMAARRDPSFAMGGLSQANSCGTGPANSAVMAAWRSAL